MPEWPDLHVLRARIVNAVVGQRVTNVRVHDPLVLRATVFPRERGGDYDDRVTFELDTYLDKRRALQFKSNPYGIQTDGIKVEGAASEAITINGGQLTLSPLGNINSLARSITFDGNGGTLCLATKVIGKELYAGLGSPSA